MANTKANTKVNTEAMTPDVAFDTGILTVKRPVDSDLPIGREISVRVHSTIIDRFEGTSHTEQIWGEKSNINVITAAAADPDIRDVCARFFINRSITRVLVGAIEPKTVRPGDVMISKSTMYNHLEKAPSLAGNPIAVSVVMELIAPYLMKVGILSTGGHYSRRFSYSMEPVTVAAIARDIAMSEIVRVMDNAKVVNITDRKYSREVFAEEVGDAMYDIGRAFLDVNSLSTIVDDLVKGVRAHVDIDAVGLKGVVDTSWRDHDVVASLSTNWVFLEAALSLPPDSSLTPLNAGWKLDKYAPGILAAIKSSPRYAIVGKAEAVRNIGLRKIRDLRGRVVSSVVWRAANPDPVGMSVYAYADDVLPNAYTLTRSPERLGEVIAQTYDRPGDLGTTTAARMLVSTLTDAVQGGYERIALLYQIDLGGYAFVENRTLIALLAERITVYFDESGLITRDVTSQSRGDDGELRQDIKMWFTIPTKEKDLSWNLSGRYDQSSYMTSSVGEAFLAMDEFEPSAAVDAKPQLYTTAAFNTRIVNFDERSVKSVNARFPFSVEVNGAPVHGSFKISDLGSMKANPNVAVVVPVFNHDVFNAVANTFTTMLMVARDLAKAADDSDANPTYTGGPGLAAFLERRVARDVLSYAQKLAPSFRAEVHRGMMSRATMNLTGERSIALRARLAQRAFGAYADVLALSLFIAMQGMAESETSFWRRITQDDVMAQTYFEVESDRDPVPM